MNRDGQEKESGTFRRDPAGALPIECVELSRTVPTGVLPAEQEEKPIQRALHGLEAEGVALTVSSIRSRLRSGGFCSLSAVLPILRRFEQLWAET
jgi:hypothetical protein